MDVTISLYTLMLGLVIGLAVLSVAVRIATFPREPCVRLMYVKHDDGVETRRQGQEYRVRCDV